MAVIPASVAHALAQQRKLEAAEAMADALRAIALSAGFARRTGAQFRLDRCEQLCVEALAYLDEPHQEAAR